jgi:hypothetical protein
VLWHTQGAFYRPERWAPSVTLGGRAIRSQVKRREERGHGWCIGWRSTGKTCPACQDKAGCCYSEGSPRGVAVPFSSPCLARSWQGE